MRRVLFDEDVPRPLRRELPGFDVTTAAEAGLSGIKNGELLRRAESEFDVFLTADRNIPFQQNTSRLALGIVVLAAGSTKLNDLRSLVSEISTALNTVEDGKVIQIAQKQP